MHALLGDHENMFAVDVGPNWRMVFEGYDRHDQQTIKTAEIITISIIAIEDYH
ncbi:hypothetical protein [Lacticaseibacillus jixiensis]|uniref:hypothetical protein n=1 Tax=Lacticaseibacillus jixiensis TaxID=3231926 RepID=UPI0036F44697